MFIVSPHFALTTINFNICNPVLLDNQMIPEIAQPLLCTTFTLTYFFHLASFYWMFCEGFYLFLQVPWMDLFKKFL